MKKTIALLGVLIACTVNVSAKSLSFCSEGNPETLTPAFNTISTSFDVTSQIYDNLVTFRPGSTDVVPSWATRWTVSSDGLEYVFSLRQGVKWHANQFFQPTRDFNADDVIFTFERQWKPSHPYYSVTSAKHPYFQTSIEPYLKTIEKLDDYTIRITIKEPITPFVSNFGMRWGGIQSAEYAQAMQKMGRPERIDLFPIGTGPFQFDRYERDKLVNFKAFDRYWAGRSRIDELSFLIFPDPKERWEKLKEGVCQIMGLPNPGQLSEMREDPRMVLVSQVGMNVSYMSYNVKQAPFNDVRVRRALNLAIDRRKILRQVYKHTAIPASNPMPPMLWGYNRNLEDDLYDPEEAKKLLAKAGYPNGLTAEILAMTVQRPYMPNAVDVAKGIQADLARIGVNLTIRSPDWQDYLKAMRVGDYQLALYGWTGDNGDPDNFLNTLLGCESVGGHNVAHFCHPQYDELVRRARTTQGRDERALLYEQAQEIFKDQAPWFTIAHVAQFKVMRREVVGFQMSYFGRHDFWGVDVLPER